MEILLFWLFVLAACFPSVALCLSYRLIIREKIAEVEKRLGAFDPQIYRNAYGGDDIHRTLLEHYGWAKYIAPLVLSCLVACGAAAAALLHLGGTLGLPAAFEQRVASISPLSLVGAAGGYLWALADIVRRHRSADLSPTALHSSWLRMLLAAATGPLLGSALDAPADLWTAFGVGALPFATMWQGIQSRINLPAERLEGEESTLHMIQGATPELIRRLREEEIDSVQRLAFANPVRLLFRTNLEWNVILDLIDQAMLVNFVGPAIEELRPIGVRGAIEMAELYWRSVEDAGEPQHNAGALLELIGERLGLTRDAAYNLAYQMYHDVLVNFIWTHWNASAPQLEYVAAN